MLSLTRRAGEKIIIGDNLITIEVTAIRQGQVRLGIQAPKDMSIHREEIYTRTGAQSFADQPGRAEAREREKSEAADKRRNR